MKTDVLVIGGSAAGIMSAITAKKHYPNKSITVVRKEDKVLIPCGIPYTMATVAGPDYNLIPDAAITGKGIELFIDEVISIDREEKVVRLQSGETISYDKLILATGSRPFLPPIKGLDLAGVYFVEKDFDLLNEIRGQLAVSKNLVIIGGGFIGVEFADECRKERDINVTIVELLDHVFSLVCDDEFCIKAEEELQQNGIRIIMGNSRVAELVGNKKVEKVKLADGRELPADVVILATGVKPNIDLPREMGLEYDEKNGIYTDEFMRTSDPDILACGDCAEKASFFGKNFTAARLASIATNEGRVAGANLFNIKREKQASINIFSTVVAGLAIGVAGLTEKQAREAGLAIKTGYAEAVNRHPGGMPGANKLGVKLIFKAYDGTLLGAQVFGGSSTGEFTNILGLAIAKKMKDEDLATMQVGTHPALTASPIAYQIVNAAENAVTRLN